MCPLSFSCSVKLTQCVSDSHSSSNSHLLCLDKGDRGVIIYRWIQRCGDDHLSSRHIVSVPQSCCPAVGFCPLIP